jgi:2-polyprenyl-3-methyl-5-hydroxy-6-metoxy-1,4-benzoquinol methylase
MAASWRARDTEITERMDDPDCDPRALQRTYGQFRVVNALLSGWRRCYRRLIRPLLSAEAPTTLLDVGSGGGDLARAFARWAHRDGQRLRVTGIDPDQRAHDFAVRGPASPPVCFRRADTADLIAEGARFDIVTSNHVLHHLDDDGLQRLLQHSGRLADRLVLHNDLRRSRVAYAAYAVLSLPFARGSFVREDGLLSIRRSYRREELARIAPPGWQVRAERPYRLMLLLDVEEVARA